MSEPGERFAPAVGLLEFGSIVAGIVAGDAMVKASPVASLYGGTVHPGRYLVLVGGSTAAVEAALEAGGAHTLVDSMFLPDVHPAVIEVLTSDAVGAEVTGEALGIVETSASASAILGADAGVKAADVRLLALRLADDLGGKAYCLFTGMVADVEAAVDSAVDRVDPGGQLVDSRVIPQLHPEMATNLGAELRFNRRLPRSGGTS